MKTLMLILAVLMLVPAVWAANDTNGQVAVLNDFDGHGLFPVLSPRSGSPKNKVQKKVGYYSLNFETDWAAIDGRGKKAGETSDLTGYQSVALDIRVDNPKNDVDTAKLQVFLVQWDSQVRKEIHWRFHTDRTIVPSDNKWYRLIIPISSFETGIWGEPTTDKLDKVTSFRVALEIGNVLVKKYQTDFKNLAVSMAPVTEVQVIPLDK